MKCILVVFALFSFTLHAQEDCTPKYWTIKGNLTPELKAFDTFLAGLPETKIPSGPINAFIQKEGLLLQLRTASEQVHGYTDYLIAHGALGLSMGTLFKRMRNWSNAKVTFDTVYEVENPKATRALRQWSVPMGARPDAVDGFNVIYHETLRGVCHEMNRVVTLAVSNEGNYRAVDRDTYPKGENVPEAKCPAQRALFGKSPYSVCKQFEDIKSGATRTLIWNEPVN